MLRAFQQACEQAVRQFDGTVVQCNEQGLLVCFGYPVAYEDAARRAARAGLGILEDLKALGEQLRREHKLELNPWVGIHTGPAVVEAGEDAVSLVGEARNVAVRLEDVAEPGQIVCTAATHRLIRGQFRLHSLGHRKIKGVAQPVELFLVQGLGEDRSPIEAAGPAGLTPLTGRDHEISLLKDRWEQAQEGMGQVVLLIGEPGLGKSRLVYTLKEHVVGPVTGEASAVGRSKPTQDSPVIEWRCSPHFQNTRPVPGHRLLRAGPRLRPRRAAGGPVRPAGPPPGAVRPGPAGDRAAVGVAPVPADRTTAFPRSACRPARQREETFRALLEWLHTCAEPTAGPVRRRGPALGGRVHPGVPGAVPRRGPARPAS